MSNAYLTVVILIICGTNSGTTALNLFLADVGQLCEEKDGNLCESGWNSICSVDVYLCPHKCGLCSEYLEHKQQETLKDYLYLVERRNVADDSGSSSGSGSGPGDEEDDSGDSGSTSGFTDIPTVSPTSSPSSDPTASPTLSPVTTFPSVSPTNSPTLVPTTTSPTSVPTTSTPTTSFPTSVPTTSAPTTSFPTSVPTTSVPTTSFPTHSPTTLAPAISPTKYPPTSTPTTSLPTNAPSTSAPTTSTPSAAPTEVQSNVLLVTIDTDYDRVQNDKSFAERVIAAIEQLVLDILLEQLNIKLTVDDFFVYLTRGSVVANVVFLRDGDSGNATIQPQQIVSIANKISSTQNIKIGDETLAILSTTHAVQQSFPTASPTRPGDGDGDKTSEIAIGVSVGIIVLLIILVVLVVFILKQRNGNLNSSRIDPVVKDTQTSGPPGPAKIFVAEIQQNPQISNEDDPMKQTKRKGDNPAPQQAGSSSSIDIGYRPSSHYA